MAPDLTLLSGRLDDQSMREGMDSATPGPIVTDAILAQLFDLAQFHAGVLRELPHGLAVFVLRRAGSTPPGKQCAEHLHLEQIRCWFGALSTSEHIMPMRKRHSG